MAVKTWLGLGAMLLGAGCAQGQAQRLTEQRAYDQALCAAHGSREPEARLDLVRQRIDRDARPRLHLHAVPRAELRRSLHEAGERLAEQAVLVRAVTAIDGVQVDDFELRVVLVGPHGPVPPQAPHVETVAALVGETIPADRVERHGGGRTLVASRFAERPLLGMTAAMLEASTLMVVPVTELTGHSRRTPATVTRIAPEDAEIAAAAPVAWAVASEAARVSHTTHDQGQEVSTVWLWPRSEPAPQRLVIEWSYSAHGCAGRTPALRRQPLPSATAVHVIELQLPPGPDLETRINAAFGDRLRPLSR